MSHKYIMYDPVDFGKAEITYANDADEITRLRADLAAVTAERDRMREALKPFGEALKDNYSMQVDELPIIAGSNQMDIRFKWTLGDLRRARAALEGVTEPLATHKEPDEHLNLRNAECLPSTVAVIKPEPPR